MTTSPTSQVKKVNTVTTQVMFIDDAQTRCIIGDTIYKRERQGKSRSAYMKGYRLRRKNVIVPPPPRTPTTDVDTPTVDVSP